MSRYLQPRPPRHMLPQPARSLPVAQTTYLFKGTNKKIIIRNPSTPPPPPQKKKKKKKIGRFSGLQVGSEERQGRRNSIVSLNSLDGRLGSLVAQ